MPPNWKRFLVSLQRASLMWGVFAGGVALSVIAWTIADSRVEERALAKADAAMADASEAIQARLRSTHDVLYGVRGLYRASEHVSRDEFHRFVRALKLHERHAAIRSVTYAERVTDAELAQFLARMRQDASVSETAYARFSVRPAGSRPEYVPIAAMEPLNPNALGQTKNRRSCGIEVRSVLIINAAELSL